jgi:hypothetical protein
LAGRFYNGEKNAAKSERFYQQAIQKYFAKKETLLSGAYTVIEAVEALSKPLPARFLTGAEALAAALASENWSDARSMAFSGTAPFSPLRSSSCAI